MELVVALPIILLLAFVPVTFYGLVLWWLDRYEKEPLGLVIVAFLWGAIPAVIFSVVAQLVFDVPISALVGAGLEAELLGASVVAPFTEEIFKGAALLLLLFLFRREIDSPLDGILYGGLVGFGFAATENLFYFLSGFETGGLGSVIELAFFRSVLFGLNHALYTGCTGLGIALVRTSAHPVVKVAGPVLGLGAGMALHALHNAGAMLGEALCWPLLVSLLADWGGVAALLGILLWASARERSWIVRHLGEEVQAGTLSRHDYAVIQSYWRRVGERLQTLLRGEFSRWWRLGRYYRLATELAFAKHYLDTQGWNQGAALRIEQLRRELYELRIQR
jgi:RsiW-degrading membrane proteinase PrsW (M82 family)